MRLNRHVFEFEAILVFSLVIANWAVPHHLWAVDGKFDIGLQGGWSFENDDESFNQVDITAGYRLPWHWELGETVDLGVRLNTSLGVLDGGGDTGVVGSLGLEAALGISPGLFEIRAGSAVALLSEEEYGEEDLGGPLQLIHPYRAVRKRRGAAVAAGEGTAHVQRGSL